MALTLDLESLPATIANGTSLSPAIAIGAKGFCGIVMPAAWTAAPITFQVSSDGTTWNELFDMAGNPVMVASASAAAGQTAMVDRDLLRGAVLFKLRSGTVGSPVNQAADRVLGILVRSELW
jgi:hypothetical protein